MRVRQWKHIGGGVLSLKFSNSQPLFKLQMTSITKESVNIFS